MFVSLELVKINNEHVKRKKTWRIHDSFFRESCRVHTLLRNSLKDNGQRVLHHLRWNASHVAFFQHYVPSYLESETSSLTLNSPKC